MPIGSAACQPHRFQSYLGLRIARTIQGCDRGRCRAHMTLER